MNPRLRAASDNYSRIALSLSRLREEKSLSSFLFASTLGGEGTTTTILAVARALKDRHQSAPIVIELNTAGSKLARLCSLDPAKSLQRLLKGEITLDEALQPTSDGLMLLVSDPREKAPFDRAGLAKIIARLEERTSFVLADGPPILDSADGLAMAAVLPRLILVVESGRTRQEVLSRLRQELEIQHVEILGTILNKQKRVIPGWIYTLLAR